jgi:hypothetical protein
MPPAPSTTALSVTANHYHVWLPAICRVDHEGWRHAGRARVMKIVNELRDRFGVESVLRVLDVKPSTFYEWCKREMVQPRTHPEIARLALT